MLLNFKANSRFSPFLNKISGIFPTLSKNGENSMFSQFHGSSENHCLISVRHAACIITCLYDIGCYITEFKATFSVAVRLFWTFHNKLHNMKALVILCHHDHHFSHLYRDCVQISRNTLLYLPSLKRESPILLLM